ncbi:MAG: Mur ligase family protein [Anaerovoracaceae bacterium]
MAFNTTKIYKRVLYLKNLLRYVLFRFFAFFYVMKKKDNLKIIKHTAGLCKKEFVFLGGIDEHLLHDSDICYKISETLGNPDGIFFFSNNPDGAEAYEVRHNLYTFCHDCSIIDFNDIKIGCAVFDLDNMIDENKVLKEVLIKRKELLKAGANFLVAYGIQKGKLLNSGRIKKLIGRAGFDIVIGVGKRIRGKRNFRTIAFGETRVAYSLGKLMVPMSKKNAGFNKLAVAYKVALRCEKKKCKVIREGYMPLCASYDKNKLSDIKVITKEEICNNVIYHKYYLHLEKVMKDNRNWNEMIVLDDIFKVLNVDVPNKYTELADHSINQICARTFELAPGNIFFFRQQFKDRNDKHIEKEFLRTRLAFRAFIRRSLFIFSYKKLPSFIPHVVLEDPMEAHIAVMAWYRKQFLNARFVGITGSIGKTSTKDMVYCVLEESYKTEKNLRNTNVQVKIGRNIQHITSDCEWYVQEIGGGRPGGASRHSRMILPDVTVVTNIGSAHIGNYDSKEELMENKLGIVDGMTEQGMLFLNGDDELLWNASLGYKVIYYSVHNKDADFYAENITEREGKTYFYIVHEGTYAPMMINVVGEYNVLNAVCSYAIAKYLNMRDEDIARGMSRFKTSGVRQNIVKIGQFTFFMDCYNASLESIDSSISVLEKLRPKKGGERIAIIGDITGAGIMQAQVNEKVAETILEHNVDKIVLYGKQAKEISSYLKSSGLDVTRIEKRSTLETWMKEYIQKNDIVLLKGSSKLKLDEIIDYVYGINTADERYIDEAAYIKISKNDMNYRVFRDYASIKKYSGRLNVVKIKNKISGKKITKLWQKAFAGNNNIHYVELGKNIRHIGSECFADCKGLQEIKLSENTKYIGKKAFYGCTNLKKVIVDSEIIFLGKDAFTGCENLNEIVMPQDASVDMKKRFQNIPTLK